MPEEIKGREQQGSERGQADREAAFPGRRREHACDVKVSLGTSRAVLASAYVGSVVRNQVPFGGAKSDGSTVGRVGIGGRGRRAGPFRAVHGPVPALVPARRSGPARSLGRDREPRPDEPFDPAAGPERGRRGCGGPQPRLPRSGPAAGSKGSSG